MITDIYNKKDYYIMSLIGIIVGILIPIVLYSLFNNKIMLYILGIFFLNAMFLYWYVNKLKNNAITSPVVLFIFFFTIYSISAPFDIYLGLVNDVSLEQTEDTLRVYFIANILLLLGLLMGLILRSKIIKHNKSKIFIKNVYVYNFIALLIIVLGLVMMIYEQYRLGGMTVLGVSHRLEYFKMQRELQNSIISLPWKSFLVAGTLWIASNSKKHAKKTLIFVITLSFLFFFFLGSRSISLIITVPIIGVLVDNKQINISRKKIFLLLLLILILISPLFTNIRDSIINQYKLSSLPKESWAFSKGETGAAFYISNKIIHEQNYAYADPTYTTAILYALPSSIYEFLRGEKKPLNLSEWFVWMYYPKTYEKGGGLGFSPIAQAWMNGGILGVVTVFFVIGCLLIFFEKTTYLKYVLLPFVWLFQRTQFNAIFYEILIISILLVIILTLGRILCKVVKV
jgi:oligosaccharide repeat unit polymerase